MNRKTKVTLLALAGVVAAGSIALAAQQYGKYREIRKAFAPEKIMERIDQNGDNSVSRDEISSVIKTHFSAADGNNDEKLSKAEIVIALEKSGLPERMKRRSGRMADRISSQGDINQDGFIEISEIENRLTKIHALADWNDDGKVELAEAKRLRGGFGRHWKRGHRE